VAKVHISFIRDINICDHTAFMPLVDNWSIQLAAIVFVFLIYTQRQLFKEVIRNVVLYSLANVW